MLATSAWYRQRWLAAMRTSQP